MSTARTRVPAALVVAAALLVPVVEFLVHPLFAPRGEYGFGHHRLRDLVAGIPLALACAAALAVAVAGPARRRRRAFVLAVWWVVIVGGLTAADVVVSLWRMADQGSRIEPDDERVWRRPGGARMRGRYGSETAEVTITFDEHGFRNPPGLSRADVVFIGDSLTDALQVDEGDSFVRRVERATGRSAANLAMTAYGPQQELAVLRRFSLAYRPRVIVWQLFEGNDWADALRFAQWRAGRFHLDGEWTRRYVDVSPLAHALGRTLRGAGATLRYIDGTTARFRLRVGSCPPPGDDLEAARRELRRALTEGAAFAREHDLRLIVLLVPNARRVLGDWLVSEPGGPTVESLPIACPGFMTEAKDLCGVLGVECLDLTDRLFETARVDNRRLYFPWDQHLDVVGHRVVADAIVEALVDPGVRTQPDGVRP